MTVSRGWKVLVADLRRDIRRIEPNAHIVDISEGQFGKLQVHYSTKNLDSKQQAAIDARVRRAEEVAWETCVVCGEYGRSAYTIDPPQARVYCERHKPLEWNTIEG